MGWKKVWWVEPRVPTRLVRRGTPETNKGHCVPPGIAYIRTVTVRLKLIGCLNENPFGTASRAGEV